MQIIPRDYHVYNYDKFERGCYEYHVQRLAVFPRIPVSTSVPSLRMYIWLFTFRDFRQVFRGHGAAIYIRFGPAPVTRLLYAGTFDKS